MWLQITKYWRFTPVGVRKVMKRGMDISNYSNPFLEIQVLKSFPGGTRKTVKIRGNNRILSKETLPITLQHEQREYDGLPTTDGDLPIRSLSWWNTMKEMGDYPHEQWAILPWICIRNRRMQKTTPTKKNWQTLRFASSFKSNSVMVDFLPRQRSQIFDPVQWSLRR